MNAQEFWAHVEKRGADDCWPWMAYRMKTGQGYGQLRFQNKTQYAHRVAYFLHFGHWPNETCHDCDNPVCCNPKHLINGTRRLNVQHTMARGRWPSRRGELGGKAKLKWTQVRMIRRRLAVVKIARRRVVLALASRYSVSESTINSILHNRSWKEAA